MRPGREIDTLIAKNVFGHRVWAQAKVLFENSEKGDRPLRNYSKEIEWAFEVAKQMKMTLLPVVGGQWFAFVGPEDKNGWESPTAVLEFLVKGEFEGCGACVGENLPLIICQAALKAVEKRATAASVSPEARPEARPEAMREASAGESLAAAGAPLHLVHESNAGDLHH